jgi:hypothetical protein
MVLPCCCLLQATFDAIVAKAKSRGEFDVGIRTVPAPMTLVERKVLHKERASGTGPTDILLTTH